MPLQRPTAPLAERLNRNALIVAGCVLGMAALVAVVFLVPAKGASPVAAAASGARAASPPPPLFLDRPGPAPMPPSGASGAAGIDSPAVVPPPIAGDSTRVAISGRYTTGTTADAPLYRSPDVAPPTMRSDSEDDYWRALRSPLTVAAGVTDRREGADLPTQGGPEAGAPPVASPLQVAGGLPTRRGGDPRQPVSQLVAREGPVPVIAVNARQSNTGFLLTAGSVISAVLVTALNSDLPGDVGAQVTRDVYDSPTESVVLIPKGARLVGHLGSGVVHGQKRVALAWVRINLPNGEVIDLPGQPATDERGAAGVAADVDNHSFRTFSAAGIAAAIGAGVELSQPQNGGSVLTTPSVGQVLAGSLGQELGTVGLEIVRRELDVPPTLTLPPGALFNLLLTTDLSFPRPYGAAAP